MLFAVLLFISFHKYIVDKTVFYCIIADNEQIL